MRKKKLSFFLVLFSVSLSACSSSENGQPVLVSDLSEVTYVSKETHLGKIEISSLTSQAIERRRQVLRNRRPARVQIPGVDTPVFSLTENSSSLVLIKPKTVVMSSLFNENLEIRRLDDGNLEIGIFLALVNGVVREITTGRGMQSISSSFLIPNLDQFLSELEQRLGETPQFVTQCRCPENVSLILTDQSIPVKLRAESETCPINEFFKAYLVLTQDEFYRLKRGFLVGDVQIQSDISLSHSITTSSMRVEINRNQVRDFIFRALGTQQEERVFTSSQLSDFLHNLFNEVKASFSLTDQNITSFKEQVIHDFFTEFQNTQTDTTSFRLKRNPILRQSYELQVTKEEYVGDPVFVQTRASLVDGFSIRDPLFIQASSLFSREPPTGEGEQSSLMRTVKRGDILEISVDQFLASIPQVQSSNQTQERISNRICRNPYTACLEGYWEPSGYCIGCGINRQCPHNGSQSALLSAIAQGTIWRGSINETISYLRSYDHYHIYNDSMRNISTSLTAIGDWYFPPLPFSLNNPPKEIKYPMHLAWHYNESSELNQFTDAYERPEENPLYDQIGDIRDVLRSIVEARKAVRFKCTRERHNQCEDNDWEDQYVDHERYSFPIDQTFFQRRDDISLETALSGLSLKFSSYLQNGLREVVCSLSDFAPEILSQNRFLIPMRNSGNCHPFQGDLDETLSLSFLNRSYFQSRYPIGRRLTQWNGTRTYEVVSSTGEVQSRVTTVREDEEASSRGEVLGFSEYFFSTIAIQGTIRSVGSIFGNETELEGNFR